MIRNALKRFSTTLVDPTSGELATAKELKAYRNKAKELKVLAT
jgi:hypothetical protein